MADAMQMMGGAAPPSPVLAALHAGQPGQPPFGSSPLTMPVPNRGNEVEAIALIRGAVTALKEALRSLEPGSDLFRTVNRVMEQLDRDVPAAQVTPGIERSAMLRFMMAQRRENPVNGVLAALHPTPPAGGMSAPPPSAAAAGAA